MIRRKQEHLVSTCPTSNQGYTPTTIQLKALQTRILKMEKYEKVLASPLYVHGRGENDGSSHKPSFRETRSKNNTEERGKCKSYYSSRSLSKTELEVKFISRATSVWQTRCIVFIKERRTGKPVRLRSNLLIRPNWEDLFSTVKKITCSVRQYLTL